MCACRSPVGEIQSTAPGRKHTSRSSSPERQRGRQTHTNWNHGDASRGFQLAPRCRVHFFFLLLLFCSPFAFRPSSFLLFSSSSHFFGSPHPSSSFYCVLSFSTCSSSLPPLIFPSSSSFLSLLALCPTSYLVVFAYFCQFSCFCLFSFRLSSDPPPFLCLPFLLSSSISPVYSLSPSSHLSILLCFLFLPSSSSFHLSSPVSSSFLFSPLHSSLPGRCACRGW